MNTVGIRGADPLLVRRRSTVHRTGIRSKVRIELPRPPSSKNKETTGYASGCGRGKLNYRRQRFRKFLPVVHVFGAFLVHGHKAILPTSDLIVVEANTEVSFFKKK